MNPPALPDLPEDVLEGEVQVSPTVQLRKWMEKTFVRENGVLYNPDHEHLQHARIGALWVGIEWEKKGKRVAGEARLGTPQGSNAWMKARQRQQLRRWFGEDFGGQLPDFLITIDAGYVQERLDEDDPFAVCALVEHELYHCAQDTDSEGFPAFDRDTGRPRWTIAPHDLEEFTGVAERYGAATEDLQRMQGALRRGPTVEETAVEAACSCGASVS
jgi:hypothetical protein